MDLFVFPHPHADESQRGYFWRLSLLNGFCSPQDMMGMINYRRTVSISFDYICQRNLSSDDFLSISSKKDRCNSRYMLKRQFRVCPRCIEKKGYLKEIWDYALLPYCSKHSESLEIIESPRQILDPHNEHKITSGSCTQTLVSQQALALQTLLSSLLAFSQEKPQALSCFHHLSADQLQHLVLFLGSYIGYPDKNSPRRKSVKTSPRLAQRIIEESGRCLEQWPLNIDRLLGRPLSQSPDKRSVKSHLGYLYTALNKEFSDPDYQGFTNAFDTSLVSRWPELINRRNSRLYHHQKKQPKYVSGTEVSRQWGISINTLIYWIQERAIDGGVRTLKSGNRQITVCIGQDKKISLLLSTLNLKTTATELGLPKTCIRALLNAGYLSGKAQAPGNPWIVALSDVHRFRERVIQQAQKELPTEDIKSLDQVARFYLPKSSCLAEVVQLVLENRLLYTYRAASEGALLHSIHVDIRELSNLLSDQDSLSVPEVAVELGVKQEVAYHLVNTGILKSTDRGRLGREVSAKDVAVFKTDYVWARDLSKTVKTSSRALVANLKSLPVHPISGPDIDGCRQYLYCWKDIFQSFSNYLDF